MKRMIEVLVHWWTRNATDAAAAHAKSDAALQDATHRAGQAEAVTKSLHRRVFEENHIAQSIGDLLRGRP